MSTVNSSKVHIILEFLLLSLLTTLFKTIMAHLSMSKYKQEFISMMKDHALSKQFEILLSALISSSKRKISQIVKELLEHIADNCVRLKPSRTNRALVKGYPVLLDKILRIKNPWRIKSA